ncbi:MAG: ketol-acid reductoisomerase [Gemmataceae bacterium]
MRQIQVGTHSETVVERSDYPPEKIRSILGGDTLTILGYGSQGRGQSLNLRDSGLNVIVGLREGPSWDRAVADGWVPGQTLFPISEAARRGTIVFYLLSDAGQKEFWPTLKPLLAPGKTLVFAHGFSIVYANQTGVVPPPGIDVIMVAPKGSGTTLRRLFLEGQWVGASYAVAQDASGHARERALALCVAIGSGTLFETTFARETNSDLFGERGSLLGAIYGLWLAQYEVLRANGYSPTEAFNETVEEATQSLYPLIGEKGMDWMYANCSTTAQRGALDWFTKFHDAVKPVFEQLFKNVANGTETRRTLEANSRGDYRDQLASELKAIADSEMWLAGKVIRDLRPKKTDKEID